jgi:DNA-binding NtrC family response regulator
MATILLLDDVFETLKTRSEIIKNLGYECLTANTVKEVYNVLNQNIPDVLLIDIKTLSLSRFKILKAIKDNCPKIPVIIFSGDEKIDEAVQAITIATYNYFQRPVTAELLEAVIAKAIEYRQTDEQNFGTKSEIRKNYKMKEVICKSNVMNGC